MVALASKGLTSAQIGARYGVSADYVCQLLIANGTPMSSLRVIACTRCGVRLPPAQAIQASRASRVCRDCSPRRDREKRRMAQRAKAHRAAGLCVTCSEPAAPGRTRCEHHLAYFREYMRRRVLRPEDTGLPRGACVDCGTPVRPDVSTRSAPLPRRCPACTRRYVAERERPLRRERMRRLRAQRRAEGSVRSQEAQAGHRAEP